VARSNLPGVKPIILILAAGRGERFRAAGGQIDKLSAPLRLASATQTVLEHVIASACASGLPWHVVTSDQTAHHGQQGMGTSIAMGVAATLDAAGWLIVPGDLPLLQPESLQAVAQALHLHPLVLPIVQGQPGHPVGFDRRFREELLSLRGEQGGRAIVQRHAAHRLPLNDIGCILDVDTPEQLDRAEAEASRRCMKA